VKRGGEEKASDPGSRLFAAWERAAADYFASAARDPGALALGAGLLRAGLLAARAGQLAVEAWWSPLRPPAEQNGGSF
jgi:hypothetical protein